MILITEMRFVLITEMRFGSLYKCNLVYYGMSI